MLTKNRTEFPLNSSRAIPDEKKNKVIFVFTVLCGASKGFMKAFQYNFRKFTGC